MMDEIIIQLKVLDLRLVAFYIWKSPILKCVQICSHISYFFYFFFFQIKDEWVTEDQAAKLGFLLTKSPINNQNDWINLEKQCQTSLQGINPGVGGRLVERREANLWAINWFHFFCSEKEYTDTNTDAALYTIYFANCLRAPVSYSVLQIPIEDLLSDSFSFFFSIKIIPAIFGELQYWCKWRKELFVCWICPSSCTLCQLHCTLFHLLVDLDFWLFERSSHNEKSSPLFNDSFVGFQDFVSFIPRSKWFSVHRLLNNSFLIFFRLNIIDSKLMENQEDGELLMTFLQCMQEL